MSWPAFLTLLNGAFVTMALSVVSILLSLPLGLVLALLRRRNILILDIFLSSFVTIVRATPFVTLVLFVYFILPETGIELGPISSAILALTLNMTAFSSEIWRAAFDSFPRDQLEAAASYGMSDQKAFWRIVFPQVWRANIGPLVSEITILLKGTPAVAVIGVVEITRAASRIGAETYDPLPPFIVATLIYTSLIAIIVKSQRIIERKVEERYSGGIA